MSDYDSAREFFRSEYLPEALAIGVRECEFWLLNPVRLQPYVEAENIRMERRDHEMWMLGMYIYRATLASTEQVLAGKKSSVTYLEEPIMATARKEREAENMSENEKMKQVDAVFAALNVMAVNSRLGKSNEKES